MVYGGRRWSMVCENYNSLIMELIQRLRYFKIHSYETLLMTSSYLVEIMGKP